MDHYIIRIYRKEPDNSGMLVGIAEEVVTGGRRMFSTIEELWAILNGTKDRKDLREPEKPGGQAEVSRSF